MQISLSRNAWHYKLQTKILGKPQFSNFCPYFWLTIFCLIVSPFYYFGVGIRISGKAIWFYIGKPLTKAFTVAERVAIKTMEGLLTTIDVLVCRPLDRMFVSQLGADQLVDMYHHSRDFLIKDGDKVDQEQWEQKYRQSIYYKFSEEKAKLYMRDDQKFQTWKQLTGPSWQERLAELKKLKDEAKVAREKLEHEEWIASLEAKHKKKVAQEKREASIRAFQLKVVKVTRFIVPVMAVIAGVVVVLFFGFLLFTLGSWLTRVDWSIAGHGFLIALKWICIVGFGLGVLVGFIALLVALVKKCSLIIPAGISKPFVWFGTGVANATFATGRGFKWFGKALITPPRAVLEFVIEYIKIAKKDHCPAIVWKE